MKSDLPPIECATPLAGFFRAVAESTFGGVVTALAFAASLEGFNPEILTRPAVTPIALMGGIAGGVLVSPGVFLLLRYVRLPVRIVVCAATIAGTVALTLTAPRVGLFGAFVLLFLFAFIAFLLSHRRHAQSDRLSTLNRNAS